MSSFDISGGILTKFIDDGTPGQIVTVPDNVTVINGKAFNNNMNIKEVIIPDTVRKIGRGAFIACRNLERVRLPSRDIELEANPFTYCDSLITLTLPYGMKTVPSGLAFGCSSLRTVRLPDTVESIGFKSFSGCKALRALVIYKADGTEHTFSLGSELTNEKFGKLRESMKPQSPLTKAVQSTGRDNDAARRAISQLTRGQQAPQAAPEPSSADVAGAIRQLKRNMGEPEAGTERQLSDMDRQVYDEAISRLVSQVKELSGAVMKLRKEQERLKGMIIKTTVIETCYRLGKDELRELGLNG